MSKPTSARTKALAEILSVGSQMSNVCFNLAEGQSVQCPTLLKELQVRWDAAMKLLRAAKAKSKGGKRD